MIEGKCKPGGCASIGCEGGFYCFNADGTPKPDLTPAQQEQLRGALATFCAGENRDEVLLREPVTLEDVMREVKALRDEVRAMRNQPIVIRPQTVGHTVGGSGKISFRSGQ
jgi:hypothetical protein